MQFQFSFKHMDTSEALQAYAEEKLREPIQKFVTKPIEAHIFFSVERQVHIAHCSFKAGDGFSLEVEHRCGDMYGSIDHMVDKLSTQLKKHKEKLKDHKHERSIRAIDLDELNPQPAGREAAAEAQVDAGDIVKFEESRRRANH